MITICNRPALFLLVKPAKHCGFYNSKGEAMPPKQRRVIHEHHQKNAERHGADGRSANFYSRPCEGSNTSCLINRRRSRNFYSRPCERGDDRKARAEKRCIYFYSRPCERGDAPEYHRSRYCSGRFLLTPLREGRLSKSCSIFYLIIFLLTPLREGRPLPPEAPRRPQDFYSRPCERGDLHRPEKCGAEIHFYSRPCERGDAFSRSFCTAESISTHAPARGATTGSVYRDGNT